jgi:hypothetical protein
VPKEDTKRSSKRGSIRSYDDRAIIAGEESSATGSAERSCGGDWRGVRLGENLTNTPFVYPFIPPSIGALAHVGHTGHLGRRLGHLA